MALAGVAAGAVVAGVVAVAGAAAGAVVAGVAALAGTVALAEAGAGAVDLLLEVLFFAVFFFFFDGCCGESRPWNDWADTPPATISERSRAWERSERNMSARPYPSVKLFGKKNDNPMSKKSWLRTWYEAPVVSVAPFVFSR